MEGTVMNVDHKVRVRLFYLLFTVMFSLGVHSNDELQDHLDLMVDFSYPISIIQSVRQDVSQSVYFLQKGDHSSVSSLLQDAVSKLSSRQVVQQDDINFMQEMIDKINALIDSLEESDRSEISSLCQQLQDKL